MMMIDTSYRPPLLLIFPYYWEARSQKMRHRPSRRIHDTPNGPLVGPNPRNFASSPHPIPYQRFEGISIGWIRACVSISHRNLYFLAVTSFLDGKIGFHGLISRHIGPNESSPPHHHQAIHSHTMLEWPQPWSGTLIQKLHAENYVLWRHVRFKPNLRQGSNHFSPYSANYAQ